MHLPGDVPGEASRLRSPAPPPPRPPCALMLLLPVLRVVVVAAGYVPGPAPRRRLRSPQVRFVLLHRDTLNPEGQSE